MANLVDLSAHECGKLEYERGKIIKAGKRKQNVHQGGLRRKVCGK